MADVLHGTSGNNQLNANANRTQVYGLKGNDTLVSDGKSDVLLIGGSGDDRLIMSGGNGTLSGGAGKDTFELDYSASAPLSAVIEDLVPNDDKIVVNFAGTSTPQLTKEVSGNDVVLSDGERLNVTLKGVRDNDYFDGTASAADDDRFFEILKLTNDERENPTGGSSHASIAAQAKNLPWLTLSDGLTKAASIRAKELKELDEQGLLDEFRHTRPNDTDYETVFDDPSVGKHYPNNGENIHAGSSLPADAMSAWIGSLSHHKNILNINPDDDSPIDYLKLGVGFDSVGLASISSQHHYWEQLFGGSLSAGELETVSTADLSTADIATGTIGNKSITLDDNPNTLDNSVLGATIDALGGNDSITNTNLNVSISGGADNDTLDNNSSFVTITGGKGDDSIRLRGNAQNNLIEYAAGDGSDTVSGFNSTDTLNLYGSEYTPVTLGNDVVVSLGADSITLADAAQIATLNIDGTRSKLYLGTPDADTLDVTVDGATVQALGGNDSIKSKGNNVLFVHEGGDDTISGFNATSTLQVAGGSYASVSVDNSLILLGDTDSIKILGSALGSAKIVDANGNAVTLSNAKDIRGTDNPESLGNTFDGATIQAFGGDDTITNSGNRVSISGGNGNDSVNNNGDSVTITGGAGNDEILNNQKNGTLYIYEDGDDTIEGFNDSDTLNIGGYTSETNQSGNDVIVNIISGSAPVGTVTLKDYSGANVNINSTASNPGSYIYNEESNVSVIGTEGDDFVYNNHMTISADEDSVIAETSNVTIDGGAGDDTINNMGSNVTMLGGTGDDSIINSLGDSVSVDAGTGDDTIINNGDSATILGGEDADYINVSYSNDTSIDSGAGNDTVYNYGSNVTIDGGDGDDAINNSGSYVTIDGGAGNDTVSNMNSNVTIDGGIGDDFIRTGEYGSSVGTNVSISGGAGNDYISTFISNVTLNGGEGNDDLLNQSGDSVSMDGGAGNDVIYNDDSDLVTVNGGAGNDGIINFGSNATIFGGAGNDTIENSGMNVSMLGGAGDDRISLYADSRNNYVRYAPGDGNDIIWGMTGNDTMNFLMDNTLLTSLSNGENDDLIIRVRTDGVVTGEVTIVGGISHPPKFTFDASNTSGGISGEGGRGGGSSSGSGGGGSGSGSGGGGNTSGGTSGSEGRGSDASGNASASGRGGNGGSGGSASNSTGDNGGNGRGLIRSNYVRRYGNNKTSTTSAEALKLYNALLSQAQQTPATAQHVYTGGNQVIANYQSGEKIIFGEQYTGAFYDGAGNFIAGSSTGALAVENAMDKVIDLSDAAGNDFVKAYAATAAGVIDGRGIAGFELINGSAGSDEIYAGDGGSQLWGGGDNVTDILVGGDGTDIFIVSKYQGSDLIVNASSKDMVCLSDATLSDIIATEENNGVVAVAFNTGNVIAAQSTEALSAAFILADGSAYRFNHMNKSWQNA